MTNFPEVTSKPIRVGDTFKTPYQWAAEFAPEGQLSIYKDALLWLEGEEFGDLDDLKSKANQAVAFLAGERQTDIDLSRPFYVRPGAVVENGKGDADDEDDEEDPPYQSAAAAAAAGGAWRDPGRANRRGPRVRRPPLTVQDLAEMTYHRCIEMLNRSFRYDGPSLRLSEVDDRFTPNLCTYPAFIARIRTEIASRGQPFELVGQAKPRDRFQAKSSPGKGRNFNFKVQFHHGGIWKARAQIHVLWE